MKPDAREADEAYLMAQTAIAQLKSAIHVILAGDGTDGLRKTDLGRLLGIGRGDVRHKEYIPFTLLAMNGG